MCVVWGVLLACMVGVRAVPTVNHAAQPLSADSVNLEEAADLANQDLEVASRKEVQEWAADISATVDKNLDMNHVLDVPNAETFEQCRKSIQERSGTLTKANEAEVYRCAMSQLKAIAEMEARLDNAKTNIEVTAVPDRAEPKPPCKVPIGTALLIYLQEVVPIWPFYTDNPCTKPHFVPE